MVDARDFDICRNRFCSQRIYITDWAYEAPNEVVRENKNWLDCFAVGTLQDVLSTTNLLDHFMAQEVFNIKVIALGGDKVLLTFDSIETMNCYLNERGIGYLNGY